MVDVGAELLDQDAEHLDAAVDVAAAAREGRGQRGPKIEPNCE